MDRRGGTAAQRVRIGISACLLGHEVRYDGGHKRDAFLVDVFGPFVEWVPVCPEVELGLGVPRPTLRLERDGTDVTLVMPSTGEDYTARMHRYAQRRVATLAGEELSGYVLKKDSPSCGMERVKVYGPARLPARSGRGLFADALLRRYPQLPVEEEGRLNDPRLRENFIERVFAYSRLRALFGSRWSIGDLVRFHTAHKLQVLAHSPPAYTRLGRLVAHARALARPALRAEYGAAFMDALRQPATVPRQVNVLQHIAGYFRKQLDADGRSELASVIDDYRRGLVPVVVPITLLRHQVRRFQIEYLKGQTYLAPHPKELMLRNHV